MCPKFSHVQLPVTLWTTAHLAPLFMGFSKQEHWNRLPYSIPGDLPNLGIEAESPALAGGFFTNDLPGKPENSQTILKRMGMHVFQYNLIDKKQHWIWPIGHKNCFILTKWRKAFLRMT